MKRPRRERRDLSRHRAMVTGASSGVGVCLARSLAARSIGELMLVDWQRPKLERLAAELARGGTTCQVDIVDLALTNSVQDLLEREPDIDLLVNLAVFGSRVSVWKDDPASLRRMIQVNCQVLVGLVDGYLPRMLEQGYGGLLMLGSAAASLPQPSMAVYSATQAFVGSFAAALKADLRDSGVRVHLLNAGHAEPGADQAPEPTSSLARIVDDSVNAWLCGKPVSGPGATGGFFSGPARVAARVGTRALLRKLLHRGGPGHGAPRDISKTSHSNSFQ